MNQIQIEIDSLLESLSEEIKGLTFFLNGEVLDDEQKARNVISSGRNLQDLVAQIEMLRKLETRLQRS